MEKIDGNWGALFTWPKRPRNQLWNCKKNKDFRFEVAIFDSYLLVNIQKAIKNGHRNSGFTH
jgi:hypothetical protein